MVQKDALDEVSEQFELLDFDKTGTINVSDIRQMDEAERLENEGISPRSPSS